MRLVDVIILALVIALIPTCITAQTVTIEEKFPAVQQGVFYIYRTTPVAPSSTVIYFDSNVTIKSVSADLVVVYEEHTQYINGTKSFVGNATFYVKWQNVNWFLVFYNVINLTKHLEDWVAGLVNGFDSGNYSIVALNYTYNNVTLEAYNVSYIAFNYATNSTKIKQKVWGYLIVLKDYGLVVEKAQYIATYNVTSGCLIAQNNAITKLIATNFEPLLQKASNIRYPWWAEYLVTFLFIVFSIVLIFLIERKH